MGQMQWIPLNTQENTDHRQTCPFSPKQWHSTLVRKFVERSNAKRGFTPNPEARPADEIVYAIETMLRALSPSPGIS